MLIKVAPCDLGGSRVQAQPQLVYETGAWELDAGRRELRRCGAPVPVGFRALEVFEALVKSAGELVTKDDLMGQVWPGAIVEENTLAVHISAIRKALGPDRDMLKTHSRRGYRLLGNWIAREQNASARSDDRASAQPVPRRPQGNLPVALSELIGRAAAVRRLTDLLSAYRVVTLTGTGGIGKTRLALEAARLLLPFYANDIFWVELASLSDGNLLAGAIASVLGLEVENALSVESVARAVGNRRLLLVIDNCEHLIDHAAEAAETIIRFCPAVSVLATSRELLRIEGECTYRVPPLDVPAPGEEVSAGSAIELFIARMMERRPDVQPDDRLATIAAICRRLDGIPLAIEFAAALAEVIGVEQVLSHLDDRLALLTGGRRTALPRHQTLRAALDWSYELLPEPERRLLRRLSIFPAGFTLAAAGAVMGDVDAGVPATITGIANLAAKSLVASDDATPVQRWRLLETIRAYALDKLAGSGEADAAARRHAEHYCDLLQRVEAEWESRPMAQLRSDYGWQIDNVRAAIDWAFSPGGDTLLGVALTTAAIPLWMQLSLLEECRGRGKRAIAALAPATDQHMRLEMKLQAALGASLAVVWEAVTETEATLARALHLAERLGDVDCQLRALHGLWLLKDREALAVARQFHAAASTPADRLLGEDMIAVSSHWSGDLATARQHFEHVLLHDDADHSARRIVRFQISRRSLAQAFLARTLWLTGSPDQAISIARRVVEDARAEDHAMSLCHAVGLGGCSVALWVGDLSLAECCINLVLDHAATHGLAMHRAFGKACYGMLLVRRADLAGGVSLLREGFEAFGTESAGYRVLMFLGELADVLGRNGQRAEGLAAVNDALERGERSSEGWVMAELLRVKGELLRLERTPGNANAAEGCFRKALQLAGTQAALAWELRAATSLARLWLDQRRYADGVGVLQPVYDRFTEGFETADLTAARALLGELSDGAPT